MSKDLRNLSTKKRGVKGFAAAAAETASLVTACRAEPMRGTAADDATAAINIGASECGSASKACWDACIRGEKDEALCGTPPMSVDIRNG